MGHPGGESSQTFQSTASVHDNQCRLNRRNCHFLASGSFPRGSGTTVGSGVGHSSFARWRDFNIVALLASLALAGLVFFIGRRFPLVERLLRSTGYFGTFIIGILYDYSFTAFPATALLVLIGKSQNVVMAGTVATFGAVVGDLALFGLFRSSKLFRSDQLRHQNRYSMWWAPIERRISPSWRSVVIVALVVLILVLPLPNELADFLLARTRRITTRTMIVISYIGNGIGIYTIVWLAKVA